MQKESITMTQAEIATDETNRLIASNKVEGTSVYNRDPSYGREVRSHYGIGYL